MAFKQANLSFRDSHRLCLKKVQKTSFHGVPPESWHSITMCLGSKHQLWPYAVLNHNNPVYQALQMTTISPKENIALPQCNLWNPLALHNRKQMLWAMLPNNALTWDRIKFKFLILSSLEYLGHKGPSLHLDDGEIRRYQMDETWLLYSRFSSL